MQSFKATISAVIAIALTSFAGCAHIIVPRELTDARAAYQHAATGRASDLIPAELHKAAVALLKAEDAFAAQPGSFIAKDLSYVAERKAQLAEVLASIELFNRQEALAGKSIQDSEHAIQKHTDAELTMALADADSRVAEANARTMAAEDALSNVAAVKHEERGVVISLSGNVLFAPDRATLLPATQTRLDHVADALMENKDRNLIVEGHTDSRGSDAHNLDLSQRRADAVRSYLVARGYESTKIQAHGIGKAQPTTDNDTAEGRANNRRVEIIVEQPRN
jgi:outer membrane protein OmpA-like peptidoglycan-associated protein